MKKLIFILAVGLLPLNVLANSAPNYFSGFYIGGGFGVNSVASTQKLAFDPAKVTNISLRNFNQSTSDTNFLSQLYIGYGHRFAPIPVYVAAEAITDFTNLSASLNSVNINSNVKQNYSYGGRLRLGYTQDRWLVYALAGLEYATITRHVTFINGGIYNSGTLFLKNISDHQGTFIKKIGAGVDIALNSHWVGQIEYAHSFYNEDRNYPVNHTIITFNNPKGTYTSSLYNGNEITVGLKYKFC